MAKKNNKPIYKKIPGRDAVGFLFVCWFDTIGLVFGRISKGYAQFLVETVYFVVKNAQPGCARFKQRTSNLCCGSSATVELGGEIK